MLNTQNELDQWEQILRARFGLSGLRAEQVSILSLLRKGHSVIGALPTGHGKSICYQFPCVAWSWRVLVVVPLLSLIEDQRARAEALGLRVFVVGPENKNPELAEWDLAFVSPERLVIWMRSGLWQRLLRSLSLLVFDEAHCLVEWRGFRPLFLELDQRISGAGSNLPPLLLLSATLSATNIEILLASWRREFIGVRGQIGRENLYLEVAAVETEAERWLHLVAHLRGLVSPNAAIVYCATRRESEEVAVFLQTAGIEAVAYHAGLNPLRRRRLEKAFRAGRLRVVSCTSAFGLGMDYPWVERILHWGTPSDLNSYWQEVGRAGRAGRAAFCILLWLRSDFFCWRDRLRKVPAEDLKMKWNELERMAEFLRTEACRKQWIALNQGWEIPPCGNCDRCLLKKGYLRAFPWQLLQRKNSPAWWLSWEIRSIYGHWPESRWLRDSCEHAEGEYCQALSNPLD